MAYIEFDHVVKEYPSGSSDTAFQSVESVENQ